MRRHWIGSIVLLSFTLPLVAVEDSAVFANQCAACHGVDGRAQTPQGRKLKARNLRESRLTDAEIEQLVRMGSQNKKGNSVMPAFGRDLTDAEIQAVIRVVKSFRESAPASENTAKRKDP